MMWPPPRSTLFPYTTLFRSHWRWIDSTHAGSIGRAPGPLSPPTITQWIPTRSSGPRSRSEEHTSELQSRRDLVCRLLLEKKNKPNHTETSRRPPHTLNDISL